MMNNLYAAPYFFNMEGDFSEPNCPVRFFHLVFVLNLTHITNVLKHYLLLGNVTVPTYVWS